ncbi:hypothetical protein OY671_012484, partial [Metschnikowia pulcherrima]
MESAYPQKGMPAMSRGYWQSSKRDSEAPIEARGFGTGWFAGFFAIVSAMAGSCFVAASRWPEWFAMPESAKSRDMQGFRPFVHSTLLGAYASALLSSSSRPRKASGGTASVSASAA